MAEPGIEKGGGVRIEVKGDSLFDRKIGIHQTVEITGNFMIGHGMESNANFSERIGESAERDLMELEGILKFLSSNQSRGETVMNCGGLGEEINRLLGGLIGRADGDDKNGIGLNEFPSLHFLREALMTILAKPIGQLPVRLKLSVSCDDRSKIAIGGEVIFQLNDPFGKFVSGGDKRILKLDEKLSGGDPDFERINLVKGMDRAITIEDRMLNKIPVGEETAKGMISRNRGRPHRRFPVEKISKKCHDPLCGRERAESSRDYNSENKISCHKNGGASSRESSVLENPRPSKRL